MNLPGDPGLPPGCAERHIEERMGPALYECPECEGEGVVCRSECCDAPLEKDEFGEPDLVCPKCATDCEKAPCEHCDGTGEVNTL